MLCSRLRCSRVPPPPPPHPQSPVTCSQGTWTALCSTCTPHVQALTAPLRPSGNRIWAARRSNSSGRCLIFGQTVAVTEVEAKEVAHFLTSLQVGLTWKFKSTGKTGNRCFTCSHGCRTLCISRSSMGSPAAMLPEGPGTQRHAICCTSSFLADDALQRVVA